MTANRLVIENYLMDMDGVLVLTGITSREEAQRFPFLPSRIMDSVADLVDGVPDRRGDRAQPGLTNPES